MSNENGMLIGGILFILIGLFCMLASLFNWNWFFSNYKAKPIVNFFGRKGARIFYGILGLAFIILGIVFMLMT